MNHGTFARKELEVEAHRSEGQKEISEDDGCVDAESFGSGDRDLSGDLRSTADIEEGVVLADGHVLRHVTASLPEEPHWCAIYRLAKTGADESAGSL
jgi:hypothetical protein